MNQASSPQNSAQKIKEIGLNPARGFRDILPAETSLRDRVVESLLKTYRSFGFERIEAPAVEDIRRLRGSDGGENLSLMFNILKRGDELKTAHASGSLEELVDLGLRYDLTVPLARYYGQNRSQLNSPFKAIHIGPVWRAERPQKGRYRQFQQCDIDSIGIPAPAAEIELIVVTILALNGVNLKGAQVRINDRRILLELMRSVGVSEDKLSHALVLLDKMDKVGLQGVVDLFIKDGFEQATCNQLLTDLSTLSQAQGLERLEIAAQKLSSRLNPSVFQELKTIVTAVTPIIQDGGNKIEFDPFLVRGMGYYTGAIFEISLAEFGSGSVAGGGRYDTLIGKFSGVETQACGFSIGFERIIGILEENKAYNEQSNAKVALLYEPEKDNISGVMAEVMRLRSEGKSVSMLEAPRNLKAFLERLKNSGFSWFTRMTSAATCGELKKIE